jgi:hypothetical protein
MTQGDEARYLALCGRIRAWHKERIIPLDYSPATQEQVRETEAEIGVPLPSLLRMFYSEVANGGTQLSMDELAYPLFGVVGGSPLSLYENDLTIGRAISSSGW